jgi:hypothetical protein
MNRVNPSIAAQIAASINAVSCCVCQPVIALLEYLLPTFCLLALTLYHYATLHGILQ